MMVEWLLFPVGIAICAIAVTVGIGGGILWTPVLILGCGLTPQEAVATSLMIQVAGMGSGSFAYFVKGLVDWRLVGAFFVAAIPGVVLGSIFAVRLPQTVVEFALGAMTLALALAFVSSRDTFFVDAGAKVDRAAAKSVLPLTAALGIVTGLLSVGIGEWLIPALRRKARMEMRTAVATVIPVMFLLAAVAAASHAVLSDNIQWTHFGFGAAGVLVGGQLGPRLSSRLDERLLKESFVYGLTLVGIHLVYEAL